MSAVPSSAAPLVATSGLPAVPSAEDAANAAQNLTLLNEARAEEGLAALVLHPSLAANALMWSTTMAALDDFAHNPSGFTEIKSLGWWAAGENIARIGWGGSGTGSTFHELWMNSSGHRSNILGDYTHVGIGIYRAPDGRTYATQVFANLTTTLPTPALTGFGGATTALAGTDANITVTAGAVGTLERHTAEGWSPVQSGGTDVVVPAGTSVVHVPAPATVGATEVFRIVVAGTKTTSVTWSPALAVTATTTTPTTNPTTSPATTPTTPPITPRPTTSPTTPPNDAPRESRLVSSTWPSKPRAVRLGARVTTIATVRAGAWTLERRNSGSSTGTTVRSGTASGTTRLALTLTPTKAGTTTFRLRLPATATTTSRTLSVKVTARRTSTAKAARTTMTVRPGRTAAVKVTVSSRARLERYAKGRWTKVRAVPAGTSTVRLAAGKNGTTTRYRVVVPRTTTVTGATSKVVKVVARR